jgi:hypothetical protein
MFFITFIPDYHHYHNNNNNHHNHIIVPSLSLHKQQGKLACSMLDYSLAYFSILKMEATCSSAASVDFNGQHKSQMTELFITTVVKTSNPT